MNEGEDMIDDDGNVFEQLQQKDEDIRAAVDVGKHLLEENYELKTTLQSLKEDYVNKIDLLQEENYQIQRELNNRSILHESQLQDMQQDLYNLRKEMGKMNQSVDNHQQYKTSFHQEVSSQQAYLINELEKMKSSTQVLDTKVNSLTTQMDRRMRNMEDKHLCKSHREPRNNLPRIEITRVKNEVRNLANIVDNLNGESKHLKDSLESLLLNKEATDVRKVSFLNDQMNAFQQQLKAVRQMNERINDEIQNSLVLATDPFGTPHDLDKAEADMDSDTRMTKVASDMNYINIELHAALDGLVSYLLDLMGIREKINIPDNDDGSLMQRLDTCEYEMDSVKKDYFLVQDSLKENEKILKFLTAKVMGRENDIDSTRSSFSSSSDYDDRESRMRQVLEERDNAIQKQKEIEDNYRDAQGELDTLNAQLIASAQQKFELSTQLEQWQTDMDVVIHERLNKNPESRKKRMKLFRF